MINTIRLTLQDPCGYLMDVVCWENFYDLVNECESLMGSFLYCENVALKHYQDGTGSFQLGASNFGHSITPELKISCDTDEESIALWDGLSKELRRLEKEIQPFVEHADNNK